MTDTTRVDAEELTQAVRALARLTRSVEQACQEGGLSLPQYRLLLFIIRRPQRAGEVANKAAVSRPALTGLVDGLEKKGFLRRLAVAGDRRGIRLELTPEGQEALSRAEEYLSASLAEFQERTGDTDLVPALARFGEVIEREPAASGNVEKVAQKKVAEKKAAQAGKDEAATAG